MKEVAFFPPFFFGGGGDLLLEVGFGCKWGSPGEELSDKTNNIYLCIHQDNWKEIDLTLVSKSRGFPFCNFFFPITMDLKIAVAVALRWIEETLFACESIAVSFGRRL